MTDSGIEGKPGNQSTVAAKLTPPEPGQYFVRQQLIEKLSHLVQAYRCVWISSPGGAGKTSLVRNFLIADPRPVYWYQIDSLDQDPANLFLNLARSVSTDTADNSELPLFSPDYLPNLTVFCRNFCRALFAKAGKNFVLVFDDLQEGVGEVLFGPFLTAAMAELPSHSAILMLSREDPFPLFAKERLNRKLAHLGWDDLKLSSEETRQFLTWSSHDQLQTELFEAAFDLTQGWLAGLLLFLENPDRGGGRHPGSLERVDLLFDYFAGEVFARLPESHREFLFSCSVLQTVDVALAEKLTQRQEAGDILRGLVRHNHFTSRIGHTPETFRFHPLFRQFLLSQAEQSLSTQRFVEIRMKAAQLLVDRGYYDLAAELLIDACAWQPLTVLITDHAETLLRQSRSHTLLGWLNALPAELRADNPWFCHWRGSCLLATNPDEARLELGHAFEMFEDRRDAEGCMLSWGMMVNAIVIAWNDFAELDQWISRFDRLRKRFTSYPSLEIEALMVQGICKSLAWRQPHRADLPHWADHLRQLVTTSSDSTFRLLAGSNLALYYIVSGDLPKACSLVECLNTDLHSTAVSPLKKMIWLATRAVIEWVLMDRKGCLATIETGKAIAAESGVHVLDSRLYSQGIVLGLTTGDLPLVQQFLQTLAETPVVATLDQANFTLQQADFSLLQGDTAKGIALAEMAVMRADKGGTPVIKAFSLAVLILALHENGEWQRASEVLQEGLELASSMNLFRCYFQLLAAFFALQREDMEAAHTLLREGFGLAAKQGYLNFHPWRDNIMSRLCAEALSVGIEVDYVSRLASCHNLDITPPAVPSLTPKELETLAWVQEGKTTWEIARILGVSEATVKFHVGNILRKFGASSRSQAVALAMKSGLLQA